MHATGCGCCPPAQSEAQVPGSEECDPALSKAGDPDVRRALYEAAHVLLSRFKRKDKIKTWGLAVAKVSDDRGRISKVPVFKWVMSIYASL
jgi:hypothetical protein